MLLCLEYKHIFGCNLVIHKQFFPFLKISVSMHHVIIW